MNMLQTSNFIRKTIIHHPKPDPTVLLERVTEVKDLNSGHIASTVTPFEGPQDDGERAALVKLEPMPSGHRVSLGHGKRETQEAYDKRMMSGGGGVQAANAAQADALRAAQVKSPGPSMLEASGLAPARRKA
jgi:hypothetical protein